MFFFRKKKPKENESEKSKLKKRAFTLIEIIIVVFVILTLSIIVIFNYEWGGYQITLNQSAERLTQDIRQLQSFAQSYEELEGGIVPEGGYGIIFKINPPDSRYFYTLFGDMNSNGRFDEEDVIVKRVNFEKGIVLEGYEPGGSRGANLNIVFQFPNSSVSIIEEFPPSGIDSHTSASISLRSQKTNDIVSVYINQLGMVEIRK
jgi:prepilin-type N-terminal cleavage/methylation domain-containing protein